MPRAITTIALTCFAFVSLSSPTARVHAHIIKNGVLAAIQRDRGAELLADLRGGSSPPGATNVADTQAQKEQLFEAYNLLHTLAQVIFLSLSTQNQKYRLYILCRSMMLCH